MACGGVGEATLRPVVETPDDVARLALFLLGDASEPMTGAVIDQAQFVIGPLD